MSAQYDNTNRLTLFRNRSDNAKAPDFTGPIELGDDIVEAIKKGERKFQLAAWFNKNADGDQSKDRFNGTISQRMPRQAAAGGEQGQAAGSASSQPASGQPQGDGFDDVIPF